MTKLRLINKKEQNISIRNKIFVSSFIIFVFLIVLFLNNPHLFIPIKKKQPQIFDATNQFNSSWSNIINPRNQSNTSCADINITNQFNSSSILEDFSCSIKNELMKLYSKFDRQNEEFLLLKELKNFITKINCSKIEESKSTNGSKAKMLDVCPEIYKGEDYGLAFGFKQGFVFKNCSIAKPLSSVVTIVFNAVNSYKIKTIEYLIHEIGKIYPNLTIVVGIPERMFLKTISFSQTNINTVIFPSECTSGQILNELISKVKTPYVYILCDIEDFTYHSRLQRLISVLNTYDEIAIVGGAIRNTQGYWYSNCYQMTIRNYYIHYKEGYYKSLNECMLCDYFYGPFAAKTEILNEIAFDEEISSDVLYEELFFNIRNSSYLMFSCPDVMNFLKSKKVSITYRSSWLEFAKIHHLNKIILPNTTSLDFTCDELEERCLPFSISRSYLMPLCCQSIIVKNIEIITQYLNMHNISYYVIDGTLLGAVKLGTPIPWDYDSDILIDHKTSTFLAGNSSIWLSRGFTSARFDTVDSLLAHYVKYRIRIYDYDELYFELFSTINISDYTDVKYKDIPTKIKFGNIYVNAPINPGLVSRNQYGKDFLKHKQSELLTDNQDLENGIFSPCEQSWHHACLDHFPTDGNMAFRIPQ